MKGSQTKQALLLEIEELRTRLGEAEQTLEAIRTGKVDGLIIAEQLYTLRGADHSYRILLETMEEGAATLAPEGTILYCNRRLADMLETPLNKVIGSSFVEYLSDNGGEILREMLRNRQAVRGREELYIKTSNGTPLPVLLSFGSMQIEDVGGICLTVTDLTEQKRVEEELRKAHNDLEMRVQQRTEDLVVANRTLQSEIAERQRIEEKLQRSHEELEERVQERTAELRVSEATARKRLAEIENYYNTAPIGLAVLDKDLQYVRVNELLAEMNGIPASEHIGRPLREIVQSQADEAERLARQVFISGEPVRNIEVKAESPAQPGVDRTWLGRLHPFKSETGQVVGVTVVVQEITEQRRLEEQLRQAQKMEAIGTLAGGIAHDLNNILAPILINSQMALLEFSGEHGIRDNLELILNSGLRARDLVKQLLLFGRKSEKKQEIINLTSVIKETFKLMRSSLPATIQMKLELETDTDTVYADPSQIQQVIMNLCTNAAYAMRGKTGSIAISIQSTTFGSDEVPDPDMGPGDYLVLSVRDTGYGMDEEVRKRIFDPFFTTKPLGEGTGLGLSVVYGIVKDHRGNITVYSEPGKGSIFKVYLPKVDTGASVEKESKKDIPRGSERILLVDDEELIINAVRNMLQRLGYKITALMNSEEALRLFSADPSQFDLVITDQTMPFMTGEELGKEMMRIRADIPVILCTGYADLISSEKATEMGFQRFIIKPFTVREGAELVRSVLDQKRSK